MLGSLEVADRLENYVALSLVPRLPRSNAMLTLVCRIEGRGVSCLTSKLVDKGTWDPQVSCYVTVGLVMWKLGRCFQKRLPAFSPLQQLGLWSQYIVV
jgi:hypothetical protein